MFAIDQPVSLWVQLSAVAVWLGLVFVLAQVLHLWRGASELVRKVVHIGTGNVILLAWGLHLPLWLCLGASILFSVVAYLSYRVPILPMLNGVGRHTLGVFYYAISIGCLITWFWSVNAPEYAAVGILVMAWGDGIAALAGQRWGKHSYYFMGNHKTIEGSIAMVSVSYVITCLVLALAAGEFTSHTLLIPLPVAIAAAALEAISPGGTDNLTVPIGSAALCYGLSVLIL